jgi:N-ethylmaleimide reductase
MNFSLLFSPLQVGPYRLNHRIVMAPLTRMRAEKESFAPRPLNAEYYSQRATPGGLIIAEASPVMSTGRGNAGTPGIYSDQQIEGWREVVNAVHEKGGVIFLQLWHVGRVSHSSFPARRGAAGRAIGGADFGDVEDNDGGRKACVLRDAAGARNQ